MILRDSIMDGKHFEQLLKRIDREIAEGHESIARYKQEGRDIGMFAVSCRLGTCFLYKFRAMYSAGYTIEELKPVFSDIVHRSSLLADAWSAASFSLDCLTPGTLLGFSEVDRLLTQEVLDKVGEKDWLPEFLATYNGFSYVPDTERKWSWWEWFTRISNMQTNKEREEYLALYLERTWYNSQEGEGWWNIHIVRPEDYFGYWAFDIAATVRAYGLDDSSFADHKYYPKELAHYLDK